MYMLKSVGQLRSVCNNFSADTDDGEVAATAENIGVSDRTEVVIISQHATRRPLTTEEEKRRWER